jgi:8-oxo-dGTP diphosphatase/2-hydroxy-dATP diphosphatase
MKKRGFGAGRWNGFGGKVEGGESIEAAAKRETKEECGVAIMGMEKVGIHHFRFTKNPEEVLEVHVFRVDQYKWEPVETEEMKPQWFSVSDIPYDTMWPDDRYWFPFFLKGKKFRTEFLFGEGDVVLEKDIRIVEKLDEIPEKT